MTKRKNGWPVIELKEAVDTIIDLALNPIVSTEELEELKKKGLMIDDTVSMEDLRKEPK